MNNMAIDFEALITKHAGEDGNIPAANVGKIISAISSAVGREFVAKERYNAKLDEITQLEQDKAAAEDSATKAGSWEKKYNTLKEQFDTFKTDTEAKAKLNDVKAAYRQLLTDEGIAAKYIDTVIRATSFDGMKLGEDGKLEKVDELKTAIGKDWADFKASTSTKGANVENPPKNDTGTGANPRAAEIARKFHERRYGAAPAKDGANNNE
jgi:hypothetical protein